MEIRIDPVSFLDLNEHALCPRWKPRTRLSEDLEDWWNKRSPHALDSRSRFT
jgi:hypothetical protein